ncbi:hypothetical protein ABET51_06435 [Metabacillus fastidiosus]
MFIITNTADKRTYMEGNLPIKRCRPNVVIRSASYGIEVFGAQLHSSVII